MHSYKINCARHFVWRMPTIRTLTRTKRKRNTKAHSSPPTKIALLVRSPYCPDSYMLLQFNAVRSWPILCTFLLHFQWLLSVILFSVRLPPEARDFALLQSARQAMGAHPPLVSKGRGSSLPWGKAVGAWSWPFSNKATLVGTMCAPNSERVANTGSRSGHSVRRRVEKSQL
jgi:hypothetical protein